MKQETYNLLSLITQVLIGIAAGIFAFGQWKINRRLQHLSDYIAVEITVKKSEARTALSVHFKNVGRVNLYLHKWEVGSHNSTNVRPWILPVGPDSKISVNVPITSQETFLGQHMIKLYWTDERGDKYLTIGEVAVEPVEIQMELPVEDQTNSGNVANAQPNVSPLSMHLQARAWAYKTEKADWTL